MCFVLSFCTGRLFLSLLPNFTLARPTLRRRQAVLLEQVEQCRFPPNLYSEEFRYTINIGATKLDKGVSGVKVRARLPFPSRRSRPSASCPSCSYSPPLSEVGSSGVNGARSAPSHSLVS